LSSLSERGYGPGGKAVADVGAELFLRLAAVKIQDVFIRKAEFLRPSRPVYEKTAGQICGKAIKKV